MILDISRVTLEYIREEGWKKAPDVRVMLQNKNTKEAAQEEG